MSALKKEVLGYIHEEQWGHLADYLRKHPNAIRHLLSGLHTTDSSTLTGILHAFAITASTIDRERLLDLNRRLMWLLNEESGNHCPNAALALAEIAQVQPETVLPHLPVLKVYTEDPSPGIREACRKAVARIEPLGSTLQ